MDSPQYLISYDKEAFDIYTFSFKPYYKWIVLNTVEDKYTIMCAMIVLNLIING